MKDKYKTLITACWVVLLCCFVVKLLGGNWFEIACSNEKFIAFCNWFKVGSLQYYVLTGITSIIANSLIIMAMVKEKFNKNKFTLIVILSLIILHIIRCVVDFLLKQQFILTIIDLFINIVLPIILRPKKWKRVLVGFGLIFIFQFISLIVKNIGIYNIDDNVFLSLIFIIDYYIMLGLYYLYSTREEANNGFICNIISRFRKRRNR